MMDKTVQPNEELSISGHNSGTAWIEAPAWSSGDEPRSARPPTPSDGIEIRSVPRGSVSSSATLAERTNSEKALESIANCKPSQDIEIASTGVPTSLQSENALVTWDDDRDTENPKNFSCFVKAGIGVNIGLMNFVVSLAISIFSGALEPAEQDSSPLSETTFEYGVSLFILGLAFGPAFFGPASEYYGRKWPLVYGMLGFTMATLLVTTARDLEAVMICRFLSGFCGSAAYVIPPGMFVDLFGPVGRAIGYSVFASGAFFGGSLGPGIGVALVSDLGRSWRWSMWLCSIVAVPLIGATLLLPETLEPVILQSKCSRLRYETGDWSLHCCRDEHPVTLHKYLIKPWQMLGREPVVMVVTLAFTLDYGVQSLTYSAIPKAFQTQHQWSLGRSAWVLAITLPGFTLGCIAVLVDTKMRFQKRLVAGKAIEPESRLPAMIAGMTALSLGLLSFAWKMSSTAPWTDPVMAEIVIGVGMYMVWVTATVYIQDLYVEHANSALAACAFVRYGVGAAFPTFAFALYEKLTVHWTIGLLGILCLVLVPFHVLFYFCGKKVRSWSKFALHSRVHLEESR